MGMELLDAWGPASLARAVQALREGEIVAYPTETVYGLAVDPFNPEALARLFSAKGRDREKAILLIVGDEAHLERVAARISPRTRSYMDAFWPGPLSLLLPKAPGLPEALAPGLDRICVRCPGNEIARGLCNAFGGPLTSTSANASGEAPAQSLAALTLPGVALGLDAGTLPDSLPSTILDAETGKILREGAVARALLEGL